MALPKRGCQVKPIPKRFLPNAPAAERRMAWQIVQAKPAPRPTEVWELRRALARGKRRWKIAAAEPLQVAELQTIERLNQLCIDTDPERRGLRDNLQLLCIRLGDVLFLTATPFKRLRSVSEMAVCDFG